MRTNRSAGPPEIVMLALSFPVGVATNIVTDVVRDRLPGRSRSGNVRVTLVSEVQTIVGTRPVKERGETVIELGDAKA